MLISPPFLPVRNTNEADDDWLLRAMPEDVPDKEAPRGPFPFSKKRIWHGGVHLVSPAIGDSVSPVRAIADGQVIYYRKPTAVSTIATDALNYNPSGQTTPCWTDDGCIVIKHTTDIGATADATATSTTLTFYSIYMHLSSLSCISTTTAAGQQQDLPVPFTIYRKDQLGTPGSIYGESSRIHFEIIFDDASLQSILGRPVSQPAVSENSHGRSDAIFGEIYFRFPSGTLFYPSEPPKNQATPTTASNYSSTEVLYIGMNFTGGMGVASVRADLTITTYKSDGTVIGRKTIDDFEYKLYDKAKIISNAYTTAGEALKCAVLELLRFGRIIDSENTLTPATVPVWRLVSREGGEGWVNFHAANVTVYSDADLPQWKKWNLVSSDSDGNSQCDIGIVRTLLHKKNDDPISYTIIEDALKNADIHSELDKVICKAPSEWSNAAFDTRWDWLKQVAEGQVAMTVDEFDTFKKHVTALCFWENMNSPGIEASHWHMNPIAFIRHFRKCGWLSQNEFAQCIPRKQILLEDDDWNVGTVASWNTANTRAESWSKQVNFATRRYLIVESKQRLLHFLAQVMAESGHFKFVKEIGGASASYSPYYGRGLIQLTHSANYKTYGQYRGFRISNPSSDPVFSAIGWNPNTLIASSNATDTAAAVFNAHNCADSAGMYWIAMATTGNALKKSDPGISIDDVVNTSKATNGNVSNPKINGLDSRICAFMNIKYILLENIRTAETESITFDWRRKSVTENVLDANGAIVMITNSDGTQTPKKKFYPKTHTIAVPLNRQRP